MTRDLAMEWVGDGIRVNAVAPGVIETPILLENIERGTSSSERAKCVHRPSRSRPARDHAPGEGDGVLGRPHADAVHARVDLHVHADGAAPARRPPRGRASPASV